MNPVTIENRPHIGVDRLYLADPEDRADYTAFSGGRATVHPAFLAFLKRHGINVIEQEAS